MNSYKINETNTYFNAVRINVEDVKDKMVILQENLKTLLDPAEIRSLRQDIETFMHRIDRLHGEFENATGSTLGGG